MPSEKALVGHYLSGRDDDAPDEQFSIFVDKLRQNFSEFDISYLLAGIGDRIEYLSGTENPLDYYDILTEFAKLNRLDLRAIKQRIVYCLQAVREDRFSVPTKVIIPGTRCGFVFVPIQRQLIDHRVNGLKNLTLAAK
jgi:hypothetical protein